MVAVFTLVAPTLHASSLNILPSAHAFFGNPKTVKLTLRNDTGAPLEIRAGEAVMTIAAGKTMTVSLPAGTRITTNTATKSHVAGDLLVEVSSSLSGATVAIS
jgi:hypothetical protein